MHWLRNGQTRRLSGAAAVFVAAALLAPAPDGLGATQSGVYVAAQAESGRAIYERVCAACHQSNLQGSFEAPQLAGESFLRFWADLSPGDLFTRIQVSMPPESPGGLSDEAYLDIVAYLLQANGAPAGSTPLTADGTLSIGAIAGGASPAIAESAAGAPAAATPTSTPAAAASTAAAPSPAPETGGVTVAGAVDDYRPVTDDMLRNPDDGDWLMIRRNYQAWSYSPLADIDRANAGELELAWVWAMNEGGWNAPVADRPRRRHVPRRASVRWCRRWTPPPAISSGSTRWRWRPPATPA